MLEEKRICAFIDILGFKNEILYGDGNRREEIIRFIQKISNDDSEQSMNTQYFGPAQISHPSASVTSFSDNIVISCTAPTNSIQTSMKGGIPISDNNLVKMIEHILIKIISVCWEAIELGLLFRGGITVGSLYHKNRVVVGEALISAYELESNTEFPRIEVTKKVVDMLEKIEYFHDPGSLFNYIDGRYFLNVYSFHMGVWRDYAYHNQIDNMPMTQVFELVETYISNAKENVAKFKQTGMKKIADKWQWFVDELTAKYSTGLWLEIKQNIAAKGIKK